METFPHPALCFVDDFTDTALPNVISSKAENGTDLRRPRFTRERRTWSYTLRMLTEAEKELIRAHEVAVKQSEEFNWTDPRGIDPTTYKVKISEPIVFASEAVGKMYWTAIIKLQEARPNSGAQ